MDHAHYLDIFNNATSRINKVDFAEKQLEIKTGIWIDSVVLKIQKASWCNQNKTGPTFTDGVFFSVWLSDEQIKRNRLAYNIHALKMRELKGYSIKSRDFAEAFRLKFNEFEQQWPNVGTDFGPQTLMEGWEEVDLNHFEHVIIGLAYKFLKVQHIIDELLEDRVK